LGVQGGVRAGVMLAAWLLSRAVPVLLLLGPYSRVGGDVSYFDASLAAAGHTGLAGTLVEYPLPAVGVLALPWLLAAASGLPYAVPLITAAAVTDLTFAVLLLRASPGWWPATTWVVGVPLLGVTTAFARFDLVPGVLAGAALLLVAGRPRVAGVLVALATAVKLWPAVLVPALLAVARPRRSLVVPGAVTGGVLVVATVALAGWERVVSPLIYQAERGVQIESVGATPAMLAWWLVPGRWTVAYASSRAYEVTGPGVGVLLALTTLATLLYVAGLVLAGRRLWRARDLVDGETLVWWSLVAVTGFVVTGKVLSPQYLLWLLPVVAAGLVVADGRAIRGWAAGLLVAAALTQIVFPLTYGAITTGTGPPLWVPVLALAGRNLVLVWLLSVAAVELWLSLDRAQCGSELDRQPPGPDASGLRTSR
jgi:hypothetical protein